MPKPKPKPPAKKSAAAAEQPQLKVGLRVNDPALLKELGLDGLSDKELETEINRRVLAAAAEKRGRGRPLGSKNAESKRTKGACNLSLDLDVIAWLDTFQPERSSVANGILREAMDKRTKPAKKLSRR